MCAPLRAGEVKMLNFRKSSGTYYSFTFQFWFKYVLAPTTIYIRNFEQGENEKYLNERNLNR